MKRTTYSAAGAVAIGPYSHAAESDNLVFLSGQTPIDSSSGKLTEGDISAQTNQCFNNLFNVLSAAGLSHNEVIKVNVYLTDMGDFAAMNAIYATKFGAPYPARTTIGVASLPLGAKVEIEMTARKK